MFFYKLGKIAFWEGFAVSDVQKLGVYCKKLLPAFRKRGVVFYPQRGVSPRSYPTHAYVTDEKFVVHSKTKVRVGMPAKYEEGDPLRRKRLRLSVYRIRYIHRRKGLQSRSSRGNPIQQKCAPPKTV